MGLLSIFRALLNADGATEKVYEVEAIFKWDEELSEFLIAIIGTTELFVTIQWS
jgi:hypothetical protein